ncbi:MAG: ABC transporter substrate-binding protein [Deltaproteobacteria bacterium]|nr:ABC transporter substrate-binding protein [Deltaproteobacteria bacterium]
MNIPIIISFFMLACSSPVGAATFKDAMGREITLHKIPTRIVSLAPSITETLYFLGLGERVVGVTEFSYYPPEATEKPKIGSYIDLNVEKILSLSPELAIGTKDGNQPGIVELLEQAGIPVFILNPRNVKGAIETISQIGMLCGVQKKAELLSGRLNRRLETVQNAVTSRKRPLVFLQINLRPIMAVNRNTFHHDLITLAGGINLAKDEAMTYPRISREEVIRRQPEVIIISSMDRGGGFEEARKEWLEWTSIPAVKMNRVHLINSDLIDRPSPRIIDGLEALVRLIHPEIEWKQ